tara:strand:- start:1066 stop:1404 length:339 start_codon:yes stop_codon:yes gene_type:complete
VLELPEENPKPVDPRSFSRSTWSKCSECNGSGLRKTSFGIRTEYACMHCNAVGWITPEGYRLDEGNALLLLRVFANDAVRAARSLSALKEAGADSKDIGPADYYVQGRYNGD